LEELAGITGQVIDKLVTQRVEQECRTIDVRVNQEAADKAPQLASKMLQDNQDWVANEAERLQLAQQNDERARKWLSWCLDVFGRSANTTVFFVLWGVVTAFLGWSGGINTPLKITCSTRTSLCYQVRLRAVKSALSDVPSPICSRIIQTDKGLLCQLDKSSNKSHSSKTTQPK